jgi:hypothetical protein
MLLLRGLISDPGITPELADAIITIREAQEIQDIRGFLEIAIPCITVYWSGRDQCIHH